ncbi:anhydro-N-acetylmuramic acid kinase [Vreelandella utahensis]|uniref:anhydro-N-acetylmuramic acid kinase n=1 Tax=Vreelandella halophila TaxID=86177 RepID=UPI000986CA62|nr:anhydro-N-acetylmuramic acid kinase [Halomonas utahensis]
MEGQPDWYIGLMSGTSMDGIDAVLVGFGPEGIEASWQTSRSYPDNLQSKLEELASNQGTPSLLGEADAQLGDAFADAALAVTEKAGLTPEAIMAIGSHGQTVQHRTESPFPFSLQIADPNRIAEITGITTVADFRRRDIAAGGQGAPLAPAFHSWLFRSPGRMRCLVNLGGIANITLIPGDKRPPRGHDTGPANRLMDLWCRRHQGHPFDYNGEWAASGTVCAPLLASLLGDAYFSRQPPKSTGREHFNEHWLERHLSTLPDAPRPEDVQRTLLELTAVTVTRDISITGAEEVFLAGGGAFNPPLAERIAALLPKVSVDSTAALGVDPQSVEGAAFAWLARQRLNNAPGNLPSVTGAFEPRVLGGVWPGRAGNLRY